MANQSGQNEAIPADVRTWVEIDEAALRHNVAFAASRVAPSVLLPVVKANAYGHGVGVVCPVLSEFTNFFAVANCEEAFSVLSILPGAQVVLLSPCLAAERAAVVRAGIIPTVSSNAEARAFLRHSTGDHVVPVHFKIDTGMGRLGAWKETGLAELAALKGETGISVVMVSTHLSSADEDEAFTIEQLSWFSSASASLRKEFPGAKFHALNTAGILRFPAHAMDLVRPGLLIYGVSPVPGWQEKLLPVMSWHSRILLKQHMPPGRRVSYGGDFVTSRDSKIGVLAVGYADGYFRQIPSGTAKVIVRGVLCPVVGRVTMDQILVDITDAPEVEEGEPCTLLGKNGDSEITASDLADWAGTIPWHVFTAIGPRVAHAHAILTRKAREP